MDIVIDLRTYEISKLDSTVIAKVAEKMRRDPKITSPRAKKKWPETVNMNGQKFVVMCHEESGKIVITNMRYAKKRKIRIARR